MTNAEVLVVSFLTSCEILPCTRNKVLCCILHGPGEEHIVDVVPRGRQLELQLRWEVGQAAHTIIPMSGVLEFIRHKQ
jgi:hypothetical protein